MRIADCTIDSSPKLPSPPKLPSQCATTKMKHNKLISSSNSAQTKQNQYPETFSTILQSWWCTIIVISFIIIIIEIATIVFTMKLHPVPWFCLFVHPTFLDRILPKSIKPTHPWLLHSPTVMTICDNGRLYHCFISKTSITMKNSILLTATTCKSTATRTYHILIKFSSNQTIKHMKSISIVLQWRQCMDNVHCIISSSPKVLSQCTRWRKARCREESDSVMKRWYNSQSPYTTITAGR